MENKENKILIPLDFSEHSLAGLEESYKYARFSNSEIVLLHILSESNNSGLFSKKEQEDYYEKVKNKFDEFVALVAKNTGLKVSYMLEYGKLVETILDVSERIKAKLIVVGTTKSINIMQKIVGSNALRLIREAKCPVITLKSKTPREKCENIIVPLDLTKETGQKVAIAVQIAQHFGGKIYAVAAMTTAVEYDVDKMYNKLQQVRKFVNDHNVDCETQFIKVNGGNDKIATQLLNYAKKVNGDLFMIMTQQEAEFVEFFIGSLAKQIIHSSEIPVMSIIPKSKR
ncbi:MAG: universal stress protein [Bacteroidota bacterium]